MNIISIIFNKILYNQKGSGDAKKVLDVLFFIQILHEITDNNESTPDTLQTTLDYFLSLKFKNWT